MDDIGKGIVGITTAVIAVAVLAIVLSNSSNTSNVITGFFNGVSSLLKTAISPISGSTGGVSIG